MGGIGAGCICLNGVGGLQDFSLRHKPSTSAVPDGHNSHEAAFAMLRVKGDTPVTRLVEGPMPLEKLYDQGLQAQGFRRGGHEGFPRFKSAAFENGYPFGKVTLTDSAVPVGVKVTGWNPFIPLDDRDSSFPMAVLEYEFTNPGTEPVSFEFSYHLSHLAQEGAPVTLNTPFAWEAGSGVVLTNTLPAVDEKFGSCALAMLAPGVKTKAMWFRGGWFDAVSVIWREVSTGEFEENDGSGGETQDGRNGASLLVELTLAPGESAKVPVLITWHFPNSNLRQAEPKWPEGTVLPVPAWRPFYAGLWADARAVAEDAGSRYAGLRGRTQAFADALWSSTLPSPAVDAIASNLAILKSPTVLRQENGNLWCWEGCFTDQGCCNGSCTHVWNYAQAFPHLFPALERTLREQELLRSMDETGHVQFRSALPDGPSRHDHYAAADGQPGGILKLYRDFHISGDRAWLETMYPAAKRSMDYCIATWDPERIGVPVEPHHNTYDIEFWGPDGMCGSIYIGALSAFAELAREVGRPEEGAPYARLAELGAAFLDRELFNGEYYYQHVQWEGLRETSFAEKIKTADTSNNATLRLEKAEGPKYQYGTGCLSDGIIGAWMAGLYGVKTPLNPDHVKSTLAAIHRHNFKTDLSEHACCQRPGYALGKEPGLLLCTWPRGGKPTLPFVYSDEVWTGIEYQVASHLIAEGLVDEGLEIVAAARSRYDGRTRNPFNEYECGSYYGRALASYALLGTLSGFRYDAVTKTLWIGPKVAVEPFRTFFSAASGFGTITVSGNQLSLELIEGELAVEKVVWTKGGEETELEWGVTAKVGEVVTITSGA